MAMKKNLGSHTCDGQVRVKSWGSDAAESVTHTFIHSFSGRFAGLKKKKDLQRNAARCRENFEHYNLFADLFRDGFVAPLQQWQ